MPSTARDGDCPASTPPSTPLTPRMDWIFVQLPNFVDSFGVLLAVAAILVIVISGLGLPLPEDVPLFVIGYLCYAGAVPLWFMLPAAFIALLGADCTLYWLGRRYGSHLLTIWPFRTFLKPDRLARAEAAFHKHGGKTLFLVRFLPGLRAPAYFSAGMFRVPFWKMLVFDGSAALLSVPTLILLAYFFGAQLDNIRHWTERAQLSVAVVLFAIIGTVIAVKLLRSRRKLATPGAI